MGALVDAGVPPHVLENAVAALGVGARLEISRGVRSGISATKVDVWVDGEKDLPREEYWAGKERHHEFAHAHAAQDHPHEHSHHHDEHAQSHHESEGTGGIALHTHGRGLTEIREIIGASGLSDGAKKTAIANFEALGEFP